jgi:hypothetical protein
VSKTLAAPRLKPPARPPAKRDPAPKTARTVRRLTDLFKTLADEHRLRILFLLAEHGELSVTALTTWPVPAGRQPPPEPNSR